MDENTMPQETTETRPTGEDSSGEFLQSADDQPSEVEHNPESSTEDVESSQENDAETSDAAEEEDSDYLPSEQEKVFPDDVYARYAKRYKIAPEDLSDPRIRQLLHDKINSDIEIQKRSAAQESEEVEEPTLETSETPETHSDVDVAKQRESYFKNVDDFVTKGIDPEVAKQFDKEFMSIYTDEKLTEEQRAMKSAKTFGKFAMIANDTYIPQRLGQYMELAFPGITSMYQRTIAADTWEELRNATDKKSGERLYGDLPEFGTKQYQTLMKEAAQKIPNFDKIAFSNARSMPEAMRMRYELLAKVASGQKVTPQVVKKAIEKGKQLGKEADRSRQAGNLEAGKSSGKFSATNKDDFKSWISEYNDSQRSTPSKG